MTNRGYPAWMSGRKGVCLTVKDIVTDIERAGVTKHQIEADMKTRLSQSGIQVMADAQCDEAPGKPWVYLYISILKHSLGSTYSSLAVCLEQKVFSVPTPSGKTTAKTWKINQVGAADQQRVWQSLRDLLDQFVHEFLAMNPPP